MPRNYSKLAWATNHRKLPKPLEHRLTQFTGKPVVVACIKELNAADFAAKRYQHLDVDTPEDLPTEPVSLLPSPNVGRTSYLNAVVEEVARKRGGKVSKIIRGSAPSGVSWKRHPTKRVMEVWPKDLLPPAMSHLTIQRIADQATPDRILVRIQVAEILDPTADTFRKDLLRCVNLLLENAGTADIFCLEASAADQLRRAYETIDWEPLPQCPREEVARTVMRKIGQRSSKFRQSIIDRVTVIDDLKPERRFQGGGHFTTYLAAQFTNDLVVLENLRIGAIYVMRTNWETLSKLSRAQLLAQHPDKVVRIMHRAGWQERLKRIVAEARGETGDAQSWLL